jgi:hypothetical protein
MKRIVYVRLLNEGTVVFRPVQAESVEEDTVKLLAPEGSDSAGEEWEFPLGSTVRCERRLLSEDEAWVAVSRRA